MLPSYKMSANKATTPAKTPPTWSLSPVLVDTWAGVDVDGDDVVVVVGVAPATLDVGGKLLPIALTAEVEEVVGGAEVPADVADDEPPADPAWITQISVVML